MENVIGNLAANGMEGLVGYFGRNDADNMPLLKRDMEMLCSRANDIEDEVIREEMSCRKKRKREVDEWLKGVKDLKPEFDELEPRAMSTTFGFSLRGDPVGRMRDRVKELTEQSKYFNGLVLDDFENIGKPCLPTKMFGKQINQNLKRILPCLRIDGISRIGVYGMGGVGKTTLAKHLEYNLQKSNCCVYWVTVSREFSITGLQDKFAHLMGLNLLCLDDEERRAAILRASFSKKDNSVFILDDVWEEINLEKIGITLGVNKVIVTTRSKMVCDRMHCQRKFDMTALEEDEGWDLFKHTLGAPETLLRGEVGEIAKLVGKRCDGLPLALITVAGSMRGVVDTCEWAFTLQQLDSCFIGYHEMEDKVFPILEWSFDRLDEFEKNCFLYCCLYPEDWKIEREELVQLFSLAELVPSINSLQLECNHGHKILNRLIKVCLLEEIDNSTDRKCVKMHDLIRDMALRITSGNYISKTAYPMPRFLVKTGKHWGLKEKDDWRHSFDFNAVSWDCPDSKGFGISEISPVCPNLSTFIISNCRVDIPSSILERMHGLKVLYLYGFSLVKYFPKCISDMENLTGLLLGECYGIKSVPPLGKLKRLRVFDISETKLDDLPQGLEELVSLEKLCINFNGKYARRHGHEFPMEIFSKMRHLQHLDLLGPVHISDPQFLKGLHVYRGNLAFNIRSYNLFMTSGCRPKKYNATIIDDLHLNDWYVSNTNNDGSLIWKFPGMGGRIGRKLVLNWCNFQNGRNVVFPSEETEELDLIHCFGLSDVFFQGLFNQSKDHLLHLRIEDSEEVEFILNLPLPFDDHALVSSNPSIPFQNLQHLALCSLPNFVGLVNWPTSSESVVAGTFSSLRFLMICDCQGLKKFLSLRLLNEHLPNLEELRFEYCNQLEEIVADVPAFTANVQLLKLKKLFLNGVPRLHNICKAIIICDSIQCITVYKCPRLKKLPLFLPINPAGGKPSHPKTLQVIKGSREWWNALEWEDGRAKEALQRFLRFRNG